jgi:lipopolysaccharide/colanic/teichoic acid biosynthesis glycosyltransferase
MVDGPPVYLSNGRDDVARRVVDVLFVAAAAVLVLPLLAVLALLVKADSRGPVLYAHTRLGYGGRPFRLWKLRTMTVDADARKHELIGSNSLSWPDFKVRDDPRVTRAGRMLRASSLDELPQLWNVLRGEMTLVGPRPCSVDLSAYELWQTERLDFRPGLFGRWQARGRGHSRFPERCRMEIAGARAWSPSTAVADSTRSIAAVLRGWGAH